MGGHFHVFMGVFAGLLLAGALTEGARAADVADDGAVGRPASARPFGDKQTAQNRSAIGRLTGSGKAGWVISPDAPTSTVLVDRRGCVLVDARRHPISKPAGPRPSQVAIQKQYAAILRGPKFENTVPYMYLDTSRVVTVGVGFAIFRAEDAARMPFSRRNGKGVVVDAERLEIIQAYVVVHRHGHLARRGAQAFRNLTTVFMTEADIDRVLIKKVEKTVNEILHFKRAFPNYETYPQAAQFAILDMVYNRGIGNVLRIRSFLYAIKHRNWRAAANASARGRGPRRRKRADRQWLLEAAKAEPFFVNPGCRRRLR